MPSHFTVWKVIVIKIYRYFEKNNNFRGYFFFFSGGGLALRWALETPLKPMILTLFWKGGGGIALPLYTPLNGNIFALMSTIKFKFWIDTKKMETHFSGALKQIKQFYVNIFEKNQLSRFSPYRNLSLWKLPTTKHVHCSNMVLGNFFFILNIFVITTRGVFKGAIVAKPPWTSKIFWFRGVLGPNGCWAFPPWKALPRHRTNSWIRP